MPKRREGETYWTQEQFEKLRAGLRRKLGSRGQLPWRLLAYMLLKSPEVQPLRDLVGRRLLDSGPDRNGAKKHLNQMLITLGPLATFNLNLNTNGQTRRARTAKPDPLQALKKGVGGKGIGASGG